MIEPKAVGEDKTEERAEFIVCCWKRFIISICILCIRTFDIQMYKLYERNSILVSIVIQFSFWLFLC